MPKCLQDTWSKIERNITSTFEEKQDENYDFRLPCKETAPFSFLQSARPRVLNIQGKY